MPKKPATPASREPRFIDNPHAPEMLAEEAIGFIMLAGNVHITFTALRVEHSTHPGPLNRVVIGRVAMPVQGAQNLAVGLNDFLRKMGVDPSKPGPGETVQ